MLGDLVERSAQDRVEPERKLALVRDLEQLACVLLSDREQSRSHETRETQLASDVLAC